MNQLYAAIAVGLVGVICIMDSRMLGRLSLERPLIGATMVGIVLGDIPTALAAGATLELMSIGLINVGAAMIPDMNMGSIVATAFCILTGAGPEAALTIAVPVAAFGQAIGLAAVSYTHLVEFMGESAKLLNRDKTVLMPEPAADCPMAHMVQRATIDKAREEYGDDLAVVCYVNSTIEVKSWSDVCRCV